MKRLSEEDFHRIYQKVPRVTVDIVIKNKRGILLIKRSIKPDIGKWHLPGGTVGYKEKLVDAVKREAREETGLKVRIKEFLGVFEYMRWKEPGYGHIIDLVFLAEPISGKMKGDAKRAGKVLRFFKKLPRNMILPESMIPMSTDPKIILQGKLK